MGSGKLTGTCLDPLEDPVKPRHPFLLFLGAAALGGGLGAGLSSAALWAAGRWGLTAWAEVAYAPRFSWLWLEPRLLWGALWGLAFAPVARAFPTRLTAAGLAFSLVPSATDLLDLFPGVLGQSTFGTAPGRWTPAFVLGANALWALGTAGWLRWSSASSR